jgi:DNA-binding transcriptional LysR family regulator
MIQLARLEGFYWVAQSGGYASAARAFPYPITQPAVHQQVKKLETEFGVELFERVGKERMQLTSSGEQLFRFCAPFFEQLPGVVRSITQGDYAGTLKIHAAPMMLRTLIPAWIQRISKLRPGVQIELSEMNVPDLSVLRGGAADLMVDHLEDPPADIATMRIGTLHAFVVFPSRHPLAREKRIALDKCQDETFISYTPGTLPCELQMRAFAEHGAAPRRMLSAGSADTILGFVQAGLGFSIVPWLSPDGPKGRGIEVRVLTAPKVEFPVYAAWRKNTPENPLLDAALETAPKA